MRNCFVPLCDHKNKNNARRMMFQAPKDQKLFEKWKLVLPKKREFKKGDKICDQHFDPDDIELTWDHNINGIKVQMTRDKPRLKKNAIPDRNFPTDNTCWALKNGVQARPYVKKRRVPSKTEEPEKPVDSTPPPQAVDSSAAQSSDSLYVEMIDYADIADKAEDAAKEVDAATNDPEFDALFDDIFEVVLPSTLWGFHRDSDRNFIAFSEFSAKHMTVLKTVIVDAKAGYKFSLRSNEIMSGVMKSCDAEEVSRLLAEMDEYKVCANFLECSSKCSGLIKGAESSGDLCQKCVKEVS